VIEDPTTTGGEGAGGIGEGSGETTVGGGEDDEGY